MGNRRRYRDDSGPKHSWAAIIGMGLLVVVLYVAVQRGWFSRLGAWWFEHERQSIMRGVAEKQKARAETAAAADKSNALEPLKQKTPYPDVYNPKDFSQFKPYETVLAENVRDIPSIQNDSRLTDAQKKTQKDGIILRNGRFCYATLVVSNVANDGRVILTMLPRTGTVTFHLPTGVDINSINKGDKVLMFFVIDDVTVQPVEYTITDESGKTHKSSTPVRMVGERTDEIAYHVIPRISCSVFYMNDKKVGIGDTVLGQLDMSGSGLATVVRIALPRQW